MSKITTNMELVEACQNVAHNYKTLYVMGCFGAPMNAENKERYTQNHSYNQQTTRTVKIKAATSDTFGFDCVNLIKGLLWGWTGDKSKRYGGASYGTNGVPDISADQLIKMCNGVTTDFTNIVPGEVVWTSGHVGVYIGNGLAVECTPAWKDCVQVTAVHNIGKKTGYNGRKWDKRGKLPYITYEETNKAPAASATPATPAKPAAPAATTNKKEAVKVVYPILKKGSQGPAVKSMQLLLIGYGYSCGKHGADGEYGSDTKAAVERYQEAKGLTKDGEAGPDTLGSLYGLK